MVKRITAFIAAFLFTVISMPALAEDSCEIVVIELMNSESSQKPPKFTPTIIQYSWDQEVIDELAGIFWAETGKDRWAETEKILITQLIFNRLNYGPPFADTLYGVMHQRGEFNHGKVSDRNRENAKDYLNMCQSQQDGYFQGLVLPNSAIYMGRNSGGELEFYDDNKNCVYRVNHK